jgi:hypothetical protein
MLIARCRNINPVQTSGKYLEVKSEYFCLHSTATTNEHARCPVWRGDCTIVPAVANSTVMNGVRVYLHCSLTALLLAACVPALRQCQLPLSINWSRLVPLYWVSFGLHSLFAACVLTAIGINPRETVLPIWKRFAAQKSRLLIFVPFAAWSIARYGLYYGMIWISAALAFTELYDRNYGSPDDIVRLLARILIPATYLFVGLLLVFVYNDVIASTRNVGLYDSSFSRIDSFLLGGGTVSNFVKHAGIVCPPWIFRAAEVIYYRMFDQIGGTIIILAVCVSATQALRFVGTLLTAYYLALLVFFLWPSMGPFYTCADHFGHFPTWLATYEIQRTVISNARILTSAQRHLIHINTDYYIAFPSLHMALPIIVLWFLRRWKRIVYCLIGFDLILIPAILLLEWHYVIDLIGGVAVALAAIFLNCRVVCNVERIYKKQPHETKADAEVLQSAL